MIAKYRIKYFIILLKGLAVIAGLYLLPLGIFGLFGYSPAGHHDELWIKFSGMYFVVLGFLYLYPNSRLNTKIKRVLYYAITLSPIAVILTFAMFFCLHRDHWNEIPEDLTTGFLLTLVCATFAPLSLFLKNYIK